MNRTQFALATLALLALIAGPALAGDEITGYRGDMIADIDSLEEKVIGLAEAIPADKYSWSPAEGVRPVSGALMHLAGSNFFFAGQMGVKPPEGVKPATLETVTDKAEVVTAVKQSFDSLRGMVKSVSDDQLKETKAMFGQELTMAGILHAAISHDHEHLGQMIAYARSIGVVPPWSK